MAPCMRGIDLNILIVGQSDRQRDGEERHERMLQKAEFDVAELSLSSYLMAKSRAMPFTAMPIFPRRLFSHSQMWINVDAGISEPKDLIGKKVGSQFSKTPWQLCRRATCRANITCRGGKFTGCSAKKTTSRSSRRRVLIEQLPESANVGDMLERGEIAAMMTPSPPKPALRGSQKIRRLFADPKAEDLRYYKKNGFFPIMHVVAFKDDVLKKYPEAAAVYSMRLAKPRKSAASSTPIPTGPGSPGEDRILKKKRNCSGPIRGHTA